MLERSEFWSTVKNLELFQDLIEVDELGQKIKASERMKAVSYTHLDVYKRQVRTP